MCIRDSITGIIYGAIIGSLVTTGLILSSTEISSSTSTGALQVAGGAGLGHLFVGSNATIGGSITVSGGETISDTTQSTSTSTGSLIVAGGLGITKNLYVNGLTTTQNTVVSSSSIFSMTNATWVAPYHLDMTAVFVALSLIHISEPTRPY